MCSTRQEIETIAVGRSCGGKAQGRHSCGVACELLQGEQWQRARRLSQFCWGPCLTALLDSLFLFNPTLNQHFCNSYKTMNMILINWLNKDTHPVNLLGVQVPHLDYLTGWKQQFAIRTHTQTGHCCTVRLPLTVENKKANDKLCLWNELWVF